MPTLSTPNHYGPEKMPNTSRFLSDEEYRLIQNNIVIGCTDVLIVDPQTGEALSGYRQQKPQEGYWFSCGGRMKRGQSYQDAGVAKIEEELGVKIDPSRLELLTAYSTAFAERAQEPQEEGVHTSNAVVTLFVTPEERSRMGIKLNEEHAKTEWMPLEEIATREDNFPPVLRDAVEKVERQLFKDFTYSTTAREGISRVIRKRDRKYELIDIPEDDFEVPKGQVFFEATTESQYYSKDPFSTSILATTGGKKVSGQKSTPENYRDIGYHRHEGILLGPSEKKEINTYLLGFPVTTLIENKDGEAFVTEAYRLPQDVVDDATKIYMDLDPVNDRWYGPYGQGHYLLRYRVTRKIKRLLDSGADYSQSRIAVPASHIEYEYDDEGRVEIEREINPYRERLRPAHYQKYLDPNY